MFNLFTELISLQTSKINAKVTSKLSFNDYAAAEIRMPTNYIFSFIMLSLPRFASFLIIEKVKERCFSINLCNFIFVVGKDLKLSFCTFYLKVIFCGSIGVWKELLYRLFLSSCSCRIIYRYFTRFFVIVFESSWDWNKKNVQKEWDIFPQIGSF